MAKETKREDNLNPMPPIGWPVQFYDRGVKKTVMPGQVMQHNQDPGQIVVRYGQGTVTRQSMNATWHPLTAGRPPSPELQMHGTWDYLPGQDIPDCHYDYHRQQHAERARAAEMRKATEEASRKAYEDSLKQTPDALTARAQQVAAMAAQVAMNQGA